MKKALSVFLAVLMMFSVLSVGSFAEDTTGGSSVYTSPWHGPAGSGKPATYEQAVLVFDLNGCTMKNTVKVYDTNTGLWSDASGVTGTWAMVPQDASSMKPGYYVTLPVVTAPEGWQFDGWFCYGIQDGSSAGNDHQTYAANGSYKIPEGAGGCVIEFRAALSPATIEPNPLDTVMTILFKVFGTIIGLLMYGGDTEAGIALMEKVFGGVFS